MNFKLPALFIGAFLLSSCSANDSNVKNFLSERPNAMCVVGFTQTSEDKGTLGLFYHVQPAIVEDIKDVSYETAQGITDELGLCRETFR